MSARKVARGRGAGLGPGRRAGRGRKVKSGGGGGKPGCSFPVLILLALAALPVAAVWAVAR